MEPAVIGALRHELADRYTIESELGRGGMATVYLAWISSMIGQWRSRYCIPSSS
jgi:hypothetical protein